MQAPGGRSSFTFDDGSSRQPVPSNYRHVAAANGAVPPTGGHLSSKQPSGEAFGQRVPSRSEHHGVMDRNSTRVHAAPGGHSSLSLADGSGSTPFADRSGAPPPPHDNRRPPHHSQPMSHAPYPQQHHDAPPQHSSQPPAMPTAPLYCNEGGVHQGRSSTRVAAPPGGHSSFSFAYNPPAAPAAAVLPPQHAYARPAPNHRQQPFGNAGDSLSEHVAQVRSRSNSRNTQELVQSTDRYSQPRYPEPPTQAPAPAPEEMLYCGEGGVIRGRASTRVAAPPGGHSSFSLGWGSAESARKPGGYGRGVLPTSGRAPLVPG
jgi:hypothetical protein